MKVKIYIKEDRIGGTNGPPNLSDYRPTAYFDKKYHTCLISEGGPALLREFQIAKVTFLQPTTVPPDRFTIHEGSKIVGWVVKF